MFEHEEVFELPERELMQTISVGSPQLNALLAANVAAAVNAGTINSNATAVAAQFIEQENEIGD